MGGPKFGEKIKIIIVESNDAPGSLASTTSTSSSSSSPVYAGVIALTALWMREPALGFRTQGGIRAVAPSDDGCVRVCVCVCIYMSVYMSV